MAGGATGVATAVECGPGDVAVAVGARGRSPLVAGAATGSASGCPETTRISEPVSVGSALIRLMRAAPRGVAANNRSIMTTRGRRRLTTSSARSASVSEKASNSAPEPTDSFNEGRRSEAAIRTIQWSDTEAETGG